MDEASPCIVLFVREKLTGMALSSMCRTKVLWAMVCLRHERGRGVARGHATR